MATLVKNLPKINYNGYILTDISVRIAINKQVKDNPSLYQEYTIEGYESAEDLAQDFYEDPTLYWLIYLMNDIIDPFYGWILSETELEDFINDKYADPDALHHYHVEEGNSTPGTAISNRKYEEDINEAKRNIKIIRPQYVTDIKQIIQGALNVAR